MKPPSNRPEPAATSPAAAAGTVPPPAHAPKTGAARPARASVASRRAPRGPALAPDEAGARFRRLLLGLLVCMAIVTALALTARAPM